MKKFIFTILVFCISVTAQATEIKDIRLYPSLEYTRLVIEANDQTSYRLSIVEKPPRLVLDINVEGGDQLLDNVRNRDLASAPYLLNVRSARNTAEKVRIVFDLSDEVSYSLFSLPPIFEYGNRVVLDISPAATSSNSPGLLADLGFSAPKLQAPTAKPRPPAAKPRAKTLKEFIVVIDAGHGGEDPGAVNKTRLKEKNIVLDIAKRLGKSLDSYPDIKTKLTRSTDVFLPLATRVRIAQNAEADLFVSVHADSFNNARPRGSSVFVLSKKGASSKFARQMAEHANLSDEIGGINVAETSASRRVEEALTGIFKDGKERASRNFAQMALRNMSQINVTHGESIHSAGFAVLKSPSIPSVLIEVGFVSNPEDAKLLANKSYRSRIADQIAAAIIEYKLQLEEANDA